MASPSDTKAVSSSRRLAAFDNRDFGTTPIGALLIGWVIQITSPGSRSASADSPRPSLRAPTANRSSRPLSNPDSTDQKADLHHDRHTHPQAARR